MDFRDGIWDIYYRRSVDNAALGMAKYGLSPEHLRMEQQSAPSALELRSQEICFCNVDGWARWRAKLLYNAGMFSDIFQALIGWRQHLEPDVRLTTEPTYSARPVVASIANKVFIAYDHSRANLRK